MTTRSERIEAAAKALMDEYRVDLRAGRWSDLRAALAPGEGPRTCAECHGRGNVCPCAYGAECSEDGDGAACPCCNGTGKETK